MQIGDLVQWNGVNGNARDWAGIGIVIDYQYYPRSPNEVSVLWSDGSTAWYFERRLTIIKEVL